MANSTNTKLCKNLKNDWNPGKWVLIWEHSARAFQWIPTWQGFDAFQKSLRPYIASALKGLRQSYWILVLSTGQRLLLKCTHLGPVCRYLLLEKNYESNWVAQVKPTSQSWVGNNGREEIEFIGIPLIFGPWGCPCQDFLALNQVETDTDSKSAISTCIKVRKPGRKGIWNSRSSLRQ